MSVESPDANRMWFVERFEKHWTQAGGSKAEGRVLGLLMVTSRASVTAAELQRDLGLSAGSVSEVTRRLELLGMVERIRVAGDRRLFFRAADDVWGGFLASEQALLAEQSALADRALAEMEMAPDEKAATRLRNMRAYMTWLDDHHRAMQAEWATYRDQAQGQPT